ncbi:MAG: 30S ribosomal protein S3 [Candidatus Thermoplasmatota archaeon]|nr:30S ribosomal protein S3 [Candidatus Thermoplasmatota archaeon]
MKERKFIQTTVNKLLVTEFIRRETESAGFGGMEMKRTPFGTNITLYVNKPGLVIGRRGSKVQEITETLEKKYKVESPQIEVKEIDNPDLNPQVVSKKIALSLEKGWSYRKAGNTSLRRVMDSGARGVMIRIGGKISGERARSQKFTFGSIKYSGEPARAGMDIGFSAAKMKLGIIGISVKMLRKDYRLPDDIHIEMKAVPKKEVEVQADGNKSETAKTDE